MRKSLAAACGIALVLGLIATAGAGASTSGSAATQASQTSSTFECTPAFGYTHVDSPTEQTCITTAPNARCVEKSTSPEVVQKCEIDQEGDVNNAFVQQVIDTNGATLDSNNVQTQTGTQIANVSQSGNENNVDLSQTVNQSVNGSALTSITQDQDASLTASVCQGGSTGCSNPNDGANNSKIQQSRFGAAHASAPTVTQCQDTGETDCTPPPTCTSGLLVTVDQNSTTSNDNDLNQDAHLLGQASGTTGSNIHQKQHCPGGGIQGHVDQVPCDYYCDGGFAPQAIGDAPRNTNNAHEHLTDELSGPAGSDQNQDPGLGCCSANGGGPQSSNNLHQVGTLKATSNGAFQQLDMTGATQSGGGCLVLQAGRINTDSFTTRDSEPDGFPCSAVLNCESGVEGGCSGFPPKGQVPVELSSLTSLGFDASDLATLNFVFPATLPGL